jgi:hypothetical protein
MRVEVTADDIANGKRGLPWCCPIARAIKRASGGSRVSIGTFNGLAYDWGTAHPAVFFDLPEVARCFISDFDSGRPVEPFSFEIGE